MKVKFYFASFFFASCFLLPVFTQEDEFGWWKTTVVYQIYPRSFQDSNNDGTGDIKVKNITKIWKCKKVFISGIQSRLSHLLDIGVETIWISPIYESPLADFGYDISNFTNVDPIFGTLEEFQELTSVAHSLGEIEK